MCDIFTRKVESTIDRYLQSSFGLWNAILTINGIMLAAFSLVNSHSYIENIIVLLVTILCVFSITSIVFNFFSAKATYFRMGEVLADANDLAEETKKADIKKALFRNKIMIYSERLCLVFLVLEAAAVLVLVVEKIYQQSIT
jgi:hypothetical protein